MYLHAYEWPYISEIEHKNHSYPWSGYYNRSNDGKDNNAFTSPNSVPTQEINFSTFPTYTCIEDDCRLIGNGEPNHGDLDGDGFAGEDWFNGHDDDGDGLIDEDYWTADGIDNAEPFDDLNGDGIFNFIDENGNGIHDGPEPFFDLNGNGVWDEGEWYADLQNTGEGEPYYTSGYQSGEIAQETWDDWDSDGSYDDYNGIIDEYIDNEMTKKLFCASDAVIQTYHSSTQSGVTPLAYFYNTPVLVTKIDGLKDPVLKDKSGVVSEKSTKEISKDILKLLNNLNYYTKNIEKTKSNYKWKKFADELEKFIYNL